MFLLLGNSSSRFPCSVKEIRLRTAFQVTSSTCFHYTAISCLFCFSSGIYPGCTVKRATWRIDLDPGHRGALPRESFSSWASAGVPYHRSAFESPIASPSPTPRENLAAALRSIDSFDARGRDQHRPLFHRQIAQKTAKLSEEFVGVPGPRSVQPNKNAISGEVEPVPCSPPRSQTGARYLFEHSADGVYSLRRVSPNKRVCTVRAVFGLPHHYTNRYVQGAVTSAFANST